MERRLRTRFSKSWLKASLSARSYQLTFLAASAPFLPSAVRVFAGSCEMVFLDFAAAAAFFIFFLAAVCCFSVLIALPRFLAVLDS